MTVDGTGPAGRWHGSAYARQSGHHRAFDRWFLDRHRPRSDDVVVDAGSGSGEFTVRVAELVPDGHVIGVEPDPSMLSVARQHPAPNLEYRAGRLQQLDEVVDPGAADLVLSRAVFHWLPTEDYLAAYRAVLAVLRPGGWFHAESGGAGNISPLVELLDDVAQRHGIPTDRVRFPHAGFAFDRLREAGFEVPDGGVVTVAQRRPFDRQRLAGMLHTQASVAYVPDADAPLRSSFLAEVDRRFDELRNDDGSFDQTFVRLDVLARRPEGADG